ncbi:MAG: hypothetical protein MUC83_13475 [Pirellula sp.]|jgi:hypothetical protein|nr:hypothetical protein [Pirellula sp.]
MSSADGNHASSSKVELYREDAISPLLEASLGRSNRKITPSEWGGYVSVARAVKDRGEGFQEFVVCLVAHHLAIYLPQQTQDSVSLKKMSETIGHTLCNDPGSREKLLALQEQLLSGLS